MINSLIFGLIDCLSNFLANAILKKYNSFHMNLLSLFIAISLYSIKLINAVYFNNIVIINLISTYLLIILIQVKCGAFFVIFDEMIPKKYNFVGL